MAPVLRCEVAVVGGGFAGLSAAYHLAREGRDVVLLEAGEVGGEASGKNTGMLGPGVQGSITTLVKKHGMETAARMFVATVQAVKDALALIREERLACDLEVNGQLLLARTEKQAAALRDQAALYHSVGTLYRSVDTTDRSVDGSVAYLDAVGVTGRLGSPVYRAALSFPMAANLDPRRLCGQLALAAQRRGARVYTGCRTSSVEPGKPARLMVGSFDLIESIRRGGRGGPVGAAPHESSDPVRSSADLRPRPSEVVADHIVLATNAFTPRLGLLRGRVVPLVTHVIATAPLSAEQVRALGWPGREGCVEARRVFHYFRLDAEDRLLFGGGACTHEDARQWDVLERELVAVFPSLEGVEIERRWSGTMGFTLDRLPVVGELVEARRVLHAGAWCGHGVALSIASGARIAELVGGRGSTARLPWHRGSAPWLPPDPLRAAGIQVYLQAMQAADRFEESRA